MTFLEQELKKMVGKEPAFTEQRYVETMQMGQRME